MAALIGGNVVELDYHELKAGVDLTDKIRAAFGVDGIGVLTVSNVPNYSEARKKLLPLSRQFAILPDEIKEKYVHKDSYYSFGWSHGKEKLQGKPDISKGSYYANPQYDEPETDPAVIAKYASFVHPNIWPKEELPELEFAFKELGQIIVSVGALVAQQCDRYVHQSTPSYLPNSLEKVILESKCCKARLLHYFPISEELPSSEHKSEDTEYSSWCGWHNDHGSLTGLTSAMYLDSDGNEVVNSDETAGRYLCDRHYYYYLTLWTSMIVVEVVVG